MVEQDKFVVLFETVLDKVCFDYTYKVEVEEAVDGKVEHLLDTVPDIVDANPPCLLAMRQV